MSEKIVQPLPVAGRNANRRARRAQAIDCADSEVPATYTVEETAKILRISRNSAYEAVKKGQIPVVKIGKRLLVPSAGLKKLLQG